jgi:hypothetical protein
LLQSSGTASFASAVTTNTLLVTGLMRAGSLTSDAGITATTVLQGGSMTAATGNLGGLVYVLFGCGFGMVSASVLTRVAGSRTTSRQPTL